MDIEKAIRGRRAVREYTGEPVDEAILLALIDAAIQAPSAVNQQPWAFTVVRDARVLDKISQASKAHMLATMPDSMRSGHFTSRLGDAGFQIFYHAPALIVISATAQGPWIVEDCAMAAENLMLAACAAGLGTCWIGFAQGYLNTPEGRKALGVPEAWVSIAPIIVGHPLGATPPVARRKPEIRWVGRDRPAISSASAA
jgi:nitroreductase